MKKSLIVLVMVSMLVGSGLVVAGPLDDLLNLIGFGKAAMTGMPTGADELATRADDTSDEDATTDESGAITSDEDTTDEEIIEADLSEQDSEPETYTAVEIEEKESEYNTISTAEKEEDFEAVKYIAVDESDEKDILKRIERLENEVKRLRQALVDCNCLPKKDDCRQKCYDKCLIENKCKYTDSDGNEKFNPECADKCKNSCIVQCDGASEKPDDDGCWVRCKELAKQGCEESCKYKENDAEKAKCLEECIDRECKNECGKDKPEITPADDSRPVDESGLKKALSNLFRTGRFKAAGSQGDSGGSRLTALN